MIGRGYNIYNYLTHFIETMRCFETSDPPLRSGLWFNDIEIICFNMNRTYGRGPSTMVCVCMYHCFDKQYSNMLQKHK